MRSLTRGCNFLGIATRQLLQSCFLFHFLRSETEHTKEVVKPYDWTYTTDYKGTLLGDTATLKVIIFFLLIADCILLQSNFFLKLSFTFQ